MADEKGTPVLDNEDITDVLSDPAKLKDRIKTAFKEASQDAMHEALKHEIEKAREAGEFKRPPVGGEAAAPEAPKFKRLGEFLRAVYDWRRGAGFDERLKVLQEGDAGDAVLVPDEFRNTLLMLDLESQIVRPRATVLPMGSDTLHVPVVNDTSHASSVFGGVIGYWTEESGAITASEPTFRQVTLNAHKLAGYTTASNEMVADSAQALEALLIRMFGGAIRYYEEDAFFNGTGAGQPLGAYNTNNPSLLAVTAEAGQAATTIVYENLVNIYSRMLPESMGRAVWHAHNDTFPQIATMALNVGTGGSAVWLTNAVSGPPATIFGRPVFFTEKASTLGTQSDVCFSDWAYYLLGDRAGLQIASSPHVRFQQDETAWRFVQRVDGRPWLNSAITPRNGSTTLSAFVTVATRS